MPRLFQTPKEEEPSTTLDRMLPAPKHFDASLTDTFKQRRTSYEFSDDPISDQDLVEILWAADGVNGSPKSDHRTTPTTLNWREIDIYVVKANGVWLWKPATHSLGFIHGKDRRSDLCLLQPFAKNAPVHLVYVYDQAKTKGLMRDVLTRVIEFVKRDDISAMAQEVLDNAPLLDTGTKVMAVYMACAAMNINCLARLTFDAKKVHSTLALSKTQKALCIQTIGYKPKGLLDLAF